MRWQRSSLFILLLFLTFLGGTILADRSLFVLAAHHLVVSVVGVVWLLRRIRHYGALPATGLELPLLAYVIWLGVTTAFSADWRVSLEQSWQYLTHLLGLLIAVGMVRAGRQRWLMEGIFLLAAVVVVVSMAELASWYFGLGFGWQQPGWFSIGGFTDPIPDMPLRLSIALNAATRLGNYMMVILPLTVTWSLTARRRADRRALRWLSVGLGVVLIFTFSRGAWIGATVALGVLLFYRWTMTHQGRGLRVTLPLMALVGVVTMVLVVFAVRGTNPDTALGDSMRLDLWNGAQGMIGDSPVVGVGVHQFAARLPAYESNGAAANLSHAHNLYLNTTAEMGWGGALLLIWLSGAFLRLWWAGYRQAGQPARLRLVGILAALIGFAVHSLFDTFTYTASLIPIIIMIAYVVGDVPPKQSMLFSRGMGIVALVGLVVFGVWLARLDLAQFRFFQSRLAIAAEDHARALERVRQAQALDPHLRFYDFQEAYVLGLLADDNPDDYLSTAIDAYESLLTDVPYYDVAWVNLAALYAQNGDYQRAAETMQPAIDLQKQNLRYAIKQGEYYELAGEDALATRSYVAGLGGVLQWEYVLTFFGGAEFWQVSTPPRLAALQQAIAQTDSVARQVLLRDANPELSALELPAVRPQKLSEHFWLGYVAYHQGDDVAAAQYFEATVAIRPTGEDSAQAYAYLADIRWRQGDVDGAWDAVRRARFAFPDVAYASAVQASLLLAEGNPPDETINALLIAAVPPRVILETYMQVAYRRVGSFAYLPQVQLMGWATPIYDPWLWLAERYAQDDDPETDPAEVYQAILESVPNHGVARTRCGSACQ